MTVDVTVFRTKFARSTPPKNPDKPVRDCDRGFRRELGDMLEQTYWDDVHFAQYVTDCHHRHNTLAFGAGNVVTMTIIALDVDCPAVHGTSEPAPDAWRIATRKRILAAGEQHPDLYGYDSRGGLRVLWTLPEPVELHSADDAKRWAQDYCLCIAYFERRFGFAADPSCADWQRLFRAPHATRPGSTRPENRGLWGNPDRIGALYVEPTSEDMARAFTLTTKFAESKRGTSRRNDDKPTAYVGKGLLFELLDRRGDVLLDRHDGSFVIRCPNRTQHTTGHDGDSSTVLFPPDTGEAVGLIDCKHGHCSSYRVKDWLRFFSQGELSSAREAMQ